LIEIINKQLLLQLVGYLCYWQMGFNSVFKRLTAFFWTKPTSKYHIIVSKSVACSRFWTFLWNYIELMYYMT